MSRLDSMLDNVSSEIDKAVQHLKSGDVIAYPTESVFGFGCDPFNASAVASILQLKKRPLGKGFIVVGSHFEQVEHLVQPIGPHALAQVLSSWPGPVTWVFPASEEAPKWITGDYTTIAVRVSSHPVIRQLCDQFGGPIVSTSANMRGQIPARTKDTVEMVFGGDLKMIVSGKTGDLKKPTTIRDAISGEVLRA